MHVYTLVKLKSNRIGFFIVELRLLDYSTVSRIKCACMDWDWIMRSAHAQDLFREPEVEGDDSTDCLISRELPLCGDFRFLTCEL